jgi:two-component system chemotaxis response regulator CheY
MGFSLTPKPKILIVDDFETVRLFLRNGLNQIGMERIEEAADGQEAQRMLLEAKKSGDPFELVFCDWNMPVMNGLALLKTLRADPNFKDIVFVMVTAESETVSVVHAVKAGASSYITKPFTVDELREKVESLLARLAKAS